MTNFPTKTWKSTLAALVLVGLTPGQLAWAKTVQADFPAAVISAPTETTPVPTDPNAPTQEPTVQDVLLRVCESNGYGEACAKTLLGMLWNESNNVSTAIGDRGQARGYFQIWTKLHKISISCAEDLVCSANWTLNNLEDHSYPKYVSYAVQCHNGCNINNGYAARALRNGRNLWNQPLEISQTAPIKLALNK